MVSYPTDIVTDTGWSRIHKGHDLDRDILEADLVYAHGAPHPTQELEVSEEFFAYRPRIKNCDELGCDADGEEFHAHWSPVRPNPGAAYTLARWSR